MAGDVDRKKLWGRSGSRCAICNVELTRLDDHDVIVGDEAHIRSKQPDGPRHDPTYREPIDSYVNLILLCKAHHKLVDDNADVFPADHLDEIKSRHESRVAKALGRDDGSPWLVEPHLSWIVTGTEFAALVFNAVAYVTSHVHPRGDEASLIAGVLQEAVDWGDLASDIGPSGQVDAAMSLQAGLDALLDHGLMVIGGCGSYRHGSGLVMTTAVIRIERIAELSTEGPMDQSTC